MALCDWKNGTPCENEAANGHHWCKEHKAEYQRDFTATKKEMDAMRNYAEGGRAMQAALADAFARSAGQMILGHDCARFIRDFPLPPKLTPQA